MWTDCMLRITNVVQSIKLAVKKNATVQSINPSSPLIKVQLIWLVRISFARVKVKVCEREIDGNSRLFAGNTCVENRLFYLSSDPVTVFLPFRETLRRFARQPLTDAPSNYVSATNTTAGMTLSTILIRFSPLIVCGGHEGKPRGRFTS